MKTLAARVADAILEVSVVGGFSRIGCAARGRLFHWSDDPALSRDLSGLVMVVTGATSGLGAATALSLARRGARVWIVGRSAPRADAVRDRILARNPSARVVTELTDLADLDAVRTLAERIRRKEKRLDVLVHNAGVMVHHERRTAQGLELTTAVHVVAPTLLTASLVDLLRDTPGARVITVSSGGMYTQRLALAHLDRPPVPFDGVRAYAHAKRAQVLLNERWATEEPGITFAAMHPGWADTPGVAEALPAFKRITGPILRTAEEGADTIVWLASKAEPIPNGAFWCDRRVRSTEPLPWTRTAPADVDRLWRWVREKAGFDSPRREL